VEQDSPNQCIGYRLFYQDFRYHGVGDKRPEPVIINFQEIGKAYAERDRLRELGIVACVEPIYIKHSKRSALNVRKKQQKMGWPLSKG
jgi:hypothetical protein